NGQAAMAQGIRVSRFRHSHFTLGRSRVACRLCWHQRPGRADCFRGTDGSGEVELEWGRSGLRFAHRDRSRRNASNNHAKPAQYRRRFSGDGRTPVAYSLQHAVRAEYRNAALYHDTLLFSGLGNGVMGVRVLKRGSEWVTETIWQNKDVGMYMSSPV